MLDSYRPANLVSPVFFEHPLNERLRVFMRLEFLYNQITYYLRSDNLFNIRTGITNLLDILSIITRTDIRVEVLKELNRKIQVMINVQHHPEEDFDRLQGQIANLSRLHADLLIMGPLYLQPLQNSAFLNIIRHRNTIPGGTCEFDLPSLNYWLIQPKVLREETTALWLNAIRPLHESIAELLWITREGGKETPAIAKEGIFNITFKNYVHIQMLRIAVPINIGCYPEISGSHYRSSIRFVKLSELNQEISQAKEDIAFNLILCN